MLSIQEGSVQDGEKITTFVQNGRDAIEDGGYGACGSRWTHRTRVLGQALR